MLDDSNMGYGVLRKSTSKDQWYQINKVFGQYLQKCDDNFYLAKTVLKPELKNII